MALNPYISIWRVVLYIVAQTKITKLWSGLHMPVMRCLVCAFWRIMVMMAVAFRESTVFPSRTLKIESSWCRFCRYWRRHRLSSRQPMVPPLTTKLASWRLLRCRIRVTGGAGGGRYDGLRCASNDDKVGIMKTLCSEWVHGTVLISWAC